MTRAWDSHSRMHSTCNFPPETSWPARSGAQLRPSRCELKIMCADGHASARGIVQTNRHRQILSQPAC
jgi:hypothetical protein